jgi:hypothetical protein
MSTKNRRSPKKEKKLHPIPVDIYGIFCTSTSKLLAVSLSMDDMETEIDLGNYDEDCRVVEMKITLFN